VIGRCARRRLRHGLARAGTDRRPRLDPAVSTGSWLPRDRRAGSSSCRGATHVGGRRDPLCRGAGPRGCARHTIDHGSGPDACRRPEPQARHASLRLAVAVGRAVRRRRAGLVECYVSGLHGTITIATRFGTGPAAATGSLPHPAHRRDGRHPQPATHHRRKMRVRRTRHRPCGRNGALVRRIRSEVPASFEPAVRPLSRRPTVRRMYRALAGIRPGSREDT
jgi:hypothetical protein